MDIWLGYLIVVNGIAFFCYGLDKWKARHEKRRIPEKTLILMAAIGGSVGAYVGMQFFRHKTQKIKFYLGVPAILVVQAVIAVLLYNYF